jgi:hypothetical protein
MEIEDVPSSNGVSHAPCDTRENFILQFSISALISYLESLHVRVWCIQEQKVSAFSNITSHKNRFSAVREAFSNAYPDKEVLNKTDNKIPGHRK